MMLRNLRSTAQRYVDFAAAFSTKDMGALTKCASENLEAFTKDGNWGLVQQCIESLADRQIRALTQTYLTLSLDTLASGANLPGAQEAARRVVNMVETGAIVAKVNEKEGMVSFGESSEAYNDTQTLRSINRDISKTIQWGSLIRNLDDQIASSMEFLQKTSGLGEGGAGGAGGGRGFGMDAEMMMGMHMMGQGDFGHMG